MSKECTNPNCQDGDHISSIDNLYGSILEALKSGDEYIKIKKIKTNKYNIPGWNDYCRQVYAEAREARKTWIENGRPPRLSGLVLKNMQQTRGTFKQTLLRCIASRSRAEADSLAEKLLKKDSRHF